VSLTRARGIGIGPKRVKFVTVLLGRYQKEYRISLRTSDVTCLQRVEYHMLVYVRRFEETMGLWPVRRAPSCMTFTHTSNSSLTEAAISSL
jgi:hypothetical protein